MKVILSNTPILQKKKTGPEKLSVQFVRVGYGRNQHLRFPTSRPGVERVPKNLITWGWCRKDQERGEMKRDNNVIDFLALSRAAQLWCQLNCHALRVSFALKCIYHTHPIPFPFPRAPKRPARRQGSPILNN